MFAMIRPQPALAMLFAFGLAASYAQTPAALPTFEVASIKPAKPTPRPIFEVTSAGGLNWQTSVGQAILIAYKATPPFKIFGASGWVDSEEYVIVAKSPDGTPPIIPNERT